MKEPKFETYLIDYPYEGGSWTLQVKATSFEDAQRRLQAIANYGKVEGCLKATIPCVPGSSLLVRLLCLVKNR